jgi:ActR/RegA family two-component response regulator
LEGGGKMVEADNIRVLVARCSDARTASEEIMLDESNWAEVRRLHEEQGWSISAIARHLNLDRKTVRTWLRRGPWRICCKVWSDPKSL